MNIKLLFFMLMVSLLLGCSDSETEKAQAKRLSETYNIEIKAGDPTEFWPEQFPKDGFELTMEGTTLNNSSEALDGIEDALKIYPKGFVSSIIKSINICGSMKMEGSDAGGTFSSNSLILSSISAWNGTGTNYTNALRGVHHELSSLIYLRSIFATLAWKKLMPKNWKPSINNHETLSVNNNIEPNYASGFLTEYGMTNIENDFNVYAEFIFIEPEHIIKLATKYPIIAKKLGLIISAYTNADPEYSNEFKTYFNKTGLQKVSIPSEKVVLTLKVNTENIKPKISYDN